MTTQPTFVPPTEPPKTKKEMVARLRNLLELGWLDMTPGVAALQTNRHFLGSELDTQYAQIAHACLQHTANQPQPKPKQLTL